MNKLNIIFRTCDVVDSIHGTGRPFGLTKKEVVDVCFTSLINSLNKTKGTYIGGISHNLYIIGDKLSEERIEYLKPHATKIYNGDLGNAKSITETFNLASTLNDNDWVYFCEDDYLHTPEAITYLYELLINNEQYLKDFKNKDLFIHPADYPDRYNRAEDFYNKWHLIISKGCHWRQIYNTTYTFLCSVKSFKKYKDIFMKSAVNWNDGLFSEHVYKRDDVLCISPIPSLACHMHEVAMSPLVDWKKLIE